MKAEAGVNIHNKFLIEVRDKDTNELKQSGYAENIILDRAYTRVCNFYSYFSYIHFGTGTGTPVASGTSLFSWLGTQEVTTEETINDFPISKVTKKITLAPEEYVDYAITEVGISETNASSGNLNTHAMITDAGGNPLAITKTALDVLVIYATVFVKFINPRETFKWVNFPSNALAEYFLKHSSVSNYISCEKMIMAGTAPTSFITSKSSTKVVDGQKVTFSTRFGIDEGNGEVKGVGLLGSLRVSFPDSVLYLGKNMTDIVIGTGDGETEEFIIPNDDPLSLTIKNNDVAVTNYTSTDVRSDYISIATNGLGKYSNKGAFSKDGKTVVMTSSTSPNYCTVLRYMDTAGFFLSLPALTNLAAGGYPKMSFDAEILVMKYSGALEIYKYDNVHYEYQHLQTISISSIYTHDISEDGKFLYVGYLDAPYISVYEFNSAVQKFLLTNTIFNDITSKVNALMVSSDTKKIMTFSSTSPTLLTIQSFNEVSGEYEKEFEQSDLTISSFIKITDDYKTLFVTYSSYIRIYKLNETTSEFELFQSIPCDTAAITDDLKIIVTTTPVRLYLINDTTGLYELYDTPYVRYSDYDEVQISPDGNFLFTTGYSGWGNTTIEQLKLDRPKKKIVFDTPPAVDNAITADYFVEHIPKTSDYVLDVEFEITFGEGV